MNNNTKKPHHILRFLGGLSIILSSAAHADFRFTHNNHTYDVITTGVTWETARIQATNLNIAGNAGYLVTIDDLAENAAIAAQLSANIAAAAYPSTTSPDGGGGAYVWIGASDLAAEGTWLWTNNAQFWNGGTGGNSVGGLFNNWPSGNEPDNSGNQQDAGAISLNGWPLGSVGQWNDVNAANNLYSIVEYDVFVEGDANGDGVTDITDIVTIINIALASGMIVHNSNCTPDGVINIQDVICAINVVLNP